MKGLTIKFTGERYIPEMDWPDISYEHWHRYLFAAQLVQDKVVLDVGCGEGYGTYLLARCARRVVGIDMDHETVMHASSKYCRDNLEFRVGSAASIPMEGTSLFDVVVCFETIEHLVEEHQRSLLAETKRLLKPDGVFIVSTPNKLTYSDIPQYQNEFHRKEYYVDEFKQFLLRYFGYTVLLGQRVYGVSYIWPEGPERKGLTEHRLTLTRQGFRPTEDPKEVRYIVALCSDKNIPSANPSMALDLSDRMVTIRDEQIEILRHLASDKENALEALAAQLAERDHAVTNLQTSFARLKAERERLTAQLAERDHAVTNLQTSFAWLKAEQERLTAQLAEKERALAVITSSTAWALVQTLRRVRLVLAPSGSCGDRVLRLVIRGLRVWRIGGLKSLAGKAMRRMMRKPLLGHEVTETPNLRVGLDTTLPDGLTVGKGNALPIVGWCYDSHARVTKLQILVAGRPQPVNTYGIPRPDVLKTHWPEQDPRCHSYRSGFCGIVRFPERREEGRRRKVDVCLQTTLANGETCVKRLGVIALQASKASETVISLPESERKPEIAICMTSYNPPFDLFSKQINSIRSQTHQDWICIISDDCSDSEGFQMIYDFVRKDKRFCLYRNESRLGFYANFERVLGLVPDGVKYVALADQDDFWHSDKLESLVAEAKAGTDGEPWLVYSDMNIVDREGVLLANTYWKTRPNNYKDLASLLMANTITGAALLFRRELLEYVLPFPRGMDDLFHDHWIGTVALAMGTVAYVDRPLYDYVRHPSQVIGHCVAPKRSTGKRVVGFGKAIAKCLGGQEPVANIRNWERAYFYTVMRIQLLARILELRCAKHLTRRKRRVLQRLAKCDSGIARFGWLIARGVSVLWRVPESLGGEYVLAKGILWKWYVYIASKLERLGVL